MGQFKRIINLIGLASQQSIGKQKTIEQCLQKSEGKKFPTQNSIIDKLSAKQKEDIFIHPGSPLYSFRNLVGCVSPVRESKARERKHGIQERGSTTGKVKHPFCIHCCQFPGFQLWVPSLSVSVLQTRGPLDLYSPENKSLL